MKKLSAIVVIAFLAFSCKKSDFTSTPPVSPYVRQVEQALKDSLSPADYGSLDFIHSIQTHVDSAKIHLLRIPINGKEMAHDFVVVKTDATGKIEKGNFISISRNSADTKSSASFNGRISYTSLKGVSTASLPIINGHIQRQTITITTNSVHTNKMAEPGYDAELPEVIVYSSYDYGGGISWGEWYNLLAMIGSGGGGSDYGGGNYYTPGGGGGSGNAPAVQVDFEAPENKNAIDPKKYTNCFGSTQEANATYTITIASDIPVDNDPSKLLNWSDASPGHTYIELYKASGSSIVSQNIGFYPNSSWKVVSGANIGSKVADDAGHEYNARYSISVNAAQFQAALDAVNTNSSHDYNIGSFNCTDFALSVFNAAGGNLIIPKYDIPGGYSPAGGSSTPQGLYNRLQNMSVNGTPNIQTNANKAYGGTSHGPCN